MRFWGLPAALSARFGEVRSLASKSVAAAALIGAIAGCGGGGGGGGAILPVTPAPTPALSVSVKVNGNSAQPSNGQYAVKPADRITVTASQPVTWSTTPTLQDTAAPNVPTSTATTWTAQVANVRATATTLTVTASAGSAGTQDSVFSIAAGDPRNGTYTGFAANGGRPAFTLDFDNMAYVMSDFPQSSTGAITVDPTNSSTYKFSDPREPTTTVNNSRFRITTDTVVGEFQFLSPKSLATYALQPFVASRALVTTQSALDGIYTRLGISRTETTGDSDIRQLVISGGGTLIQYCDQLAISSVASCPVGSIVGYAVSAGPSPTWWKLQNLADANDWGYFSIASVAGKNVYLSVGYQSAAPNAAFFQIGLLESATWPNLSYFGGDTGGNWGSMEYSFDSTLSRQLYSSQMVQSDASGFSYSNLALTIPSANIVNLRAFQTGNSLTSYFTAQDGTLAAVVGARSGAAAGHIQIGLIQ